MATQYIFKINGNETNEKRNEIKRLRDEALMIIGYSIIISPSQKTLCIKGNHDASAIAHLIEKFKISNIVAF